MLFRIIYCKYMILMDIASSIHHRGQLCSDEPAWNRTAHLQPRREWPASRPVRLPGNRARSGNAKGEFRASANPASVLPPMFISKKTCHPERGVLQRSRKPALSVVEGDLLFGKLAANQVVQNKCQELRRHHTSSLAKNHNLIFKKPHGHMCLDRHTVRVLTRS